MDRNLDNSRSMGKRFEGLSGLPGRGFCLRRDKGYRGNGLA